MASGPAAAATASAVSTKAATHQEGSPGATYAGMIRTSAPCPIPIQAATSATIRIRAA